MVESLLGIVFISLLFFGLFYLSHLFFVKIFLGHAAARVARARAVGLNDFMCEKVAHIALLPVSGEQIWGENPIERAPIYLYSSDWPEARGIMEFEYWNDEHLKVTPGEKSEVQLKFKVLDSDVTLENEAECETHYKDYLR